MSSREGRKNLQRNKKPLEQDREDRTIVQLRRELALIITSLLVIIAVVATFQVGAMPVLDKVLPLAAVILAYFFGHRARWF